MYGIFVISKITTMLFCKTQMILPIFIALCNSQTAFTYSISTTRKISREFLYVRLHGRRGQSRTPVSTMSEVEPGLGLNQDTWKT